MSAPEAFIPNFAVRCCSQQGQGISVGMSQYKSCHRADIDDLYMWTFIEAAHK